jgi:hypothetical protein
MGKLSRKSFANNNPEKGRNCRIASRRAGRETVDSAAGLPTQERFKMFCRRAGFLRRARV